jgi:hypothetical protein
MPTRCNRCFLLQILLLAQRVSGTIMPIIRSSRVLYSWLLLVVFGALAAARKSDAQPSAPHHTDNLKTKAPNNTGSNQLYNTLELLMMGIMVPETRWASNKICNKKHLLHLVGILFPHTNSLGFTCPKFTNRKLNYDSVQGNTVYSEHDSWKTIIMITSSQPMSTAH